MCLNREYVCESTRAHLDEGVKFDRQICSRMEAGIDATNVEKKNAVVIKLDVTQSKMLQCPL